MSAKATFRVLIYALFVTSINKPLLAADVTSTWSSATSANWNVAGNWTNAPVLGGFPSNGNAGVSTYGAVINAAGSPYTVTLGVPITIDALTLNNANATLLHSLGAFSAPVGGINLQAGVYRLNGGSINNSTFNITGGALQFAVNTNNRFTGVTVNGAVQLADSGRLGVHSATFNSPVTLGGNNAVLGFFDTQTISPTTYNLDASGTYISTEGSGTITIPAGATIRGGNNGGIWYGYYTGGSTSAWINNGTIRADIGAASFMISPSGSNVFTNNGTLSAINGATLHIGSATWNSAAGTFHINNGTINLASSFPTSAIGAINRTGGTIQVLGNWNNAGSGFTFNGTTGDFHLNGGSISGGSLTMTSGGALRFTPNTFNRMTNVTVNGSLQLNTAGARLGIHSGATFNNQVHLSGSSAVLGFFDTQTASATTYNLDGLSSYLSMEGNGTVTLPTGTTVRGGNNGGIWYGHFSGGSTNGLINNGSIIADIGAASLSIFPSATNVFTNNGTIGAINGATLFLNAASWSGGGGTLLVNNGSLIIGSPFVTAGIGAVNRTGGSILVQGAWNNSGSGFTFNSTTGDWLLNGGSISGGSLTMTSGGRLRFAAFGTNRFTDVTVNGSLQLDSVGSRVAVVNSATFNGPVHLSGSGSYLGFFDTQTMGATTYNVDGSGAFISTDGTGVLTIPAGATIRGGNNSGIWYGFFSGGGTNNIINNGTISADVNGGTFTILPSSGGGTFSNSGTLRSSNGGRLQANFVGGNLNNVTSTGNGSITRIHGTYTINQNIAVTNQGLLFFDGNWTKNATIDASGKVVFDYPTAGPSVFTTIRNQILTGRAGGLWNGPGINSSAAAATPNTGVGYGESAVVTSLGGGLFGTPVDATAVVLRFTRLGDTNLDGDVDLDDVGRWSLNFTGELGGTGTKVWTDGDWDYDGDVDLDDVGKWSLNFTGELGGGASVLVLNQSIDPRAEAALNGLGITVVPEPAFAAVAAVLLGMSQAKRRRGKRCGRRSSAAHLNP